MSSTDSTGKADRMILIDAHALIFQVFHAIRDRMTSPSGLPTNALFGFARDLMFLRKQKPEYLVCTIDESEKTFRNDLYAEYKANRDAMPEDLRLQLPFIRRMIDAMAIPLLSHPRYEADDLMATVSKAASARGVDVWICTSDKDCRQLIDDHVQLYNVRKKKTFGRQELLEDWGIKPEQVVDLQTLVGDSVDNVPGVPGIGVKTASQLLQEYGTVENVYANLDKVSGTKRRENLKNAEGKLELSRTLVRLALDAPVQFDWDGWRLQPWHDEQVQGLFSELGFRTLLNQAMEMSSGTGGRQSTLFGEPEAGELFPFGANTADKSPPDNWEGTYHLVNDSEKLNGFLAKLRKQPKFAVDLETTGLNPLECAIVGFAFSWQVGEAWYVAVRGPQGSPVLDLEQTLNQLRPYFGDDSIAKVNQNIKYDWLVLRAHGVHLAGVTGDPMVADYLLQPGARSHNLNDLTHRELGHSMIPITDLIGKKGRKQRQLTIDEISLERVTEYAGEDADAAWRLTERLEDKLRRQKDEETGRSLFDLYQELEAPLIEVLVELEHNGIRLDVPFLKQLAEEMQEQLEAIEKEIFQLAGREFNLGSLPQLRDVLFKDLKLPAQKKTATGEPSTDQETLEKLAAMTELPGHALPKLMLEQRQLSKLKGTYVDALPELVSKKTGRIHTSFNQTVAATGRLSSSDPNLQNVPVRSEQGQQIRKAFLPEDGWQLLTADYSQIELRLLAHFSEDDTLLQAFEEDRDVHAAVAARVFGVKEDDVTKEMRRSAKTVNFGVIYGISAFGLAARLGIRREEAAEFIDSYFGRYPKVLQYQTDLLQLCRKRGYVATILGRRRFFDQAGIRASSTYHHRTQTEREAINVQVQGSAADLIKLAMLNLHRRLKRDKFRSRMLLQIHDELVFEMPPEEAKTLPEIVREEMTTPLRKQLQLKTPLKVDVACGPNWLETEPVNVNSLGKR